MNLITLTLILVIILLASVSLYIFVIKPKFLENSNNEEQPPLPPEYSETGSESLPPLPE